MIIYRHAGIFFGLNIMVEFARHTYASSFDNSLIAKKRTIEGKI
jgi:hypothetical protein